MAPMHAYIQHLEKSPLAEVAPEPSSLLDKTRYEKSSRELSPEQEAVLAQAIERMAGITARRGTPVKPFFDDAAADDHSAKLFGHVTVPQFRCEVLHATTRHAGHAWCMASHARGLGG